MVDLSLGCVKDQHDDQSLEVVQTALCASETLARKEKDEQINESDNYAWELLVHEVAAGLWVDARSGLIK